MSPLPNVDQHYTGELFRKAIHLCSLSIPIAYYFMTRSTALSILVPLTVFVLFADIARMFFPGINTLFTKLFGWLLRAHERDENRRSLNGATYVLLSACLCILLFPKLIVIAAFSILIISDTVAALIGRKIGKRPFLKKSLEGSAAFFCSAIVVVLVAPKISYVPMEYLIGGLAALVGTVVEASGIGIDDNLSIPLSVGGVMWLLYTILLPATDLILLTPA
ncbi:MAG TPA: SEC59/DGK1/VTE5 family protein [Bacteroidota bacterium]